MHFHHNSVEEIPRAFERQGEVWIGEARATLAAGQIVVAPACRTKIDLFPGCSAARSGAPLIRDRPRFGVCKGPGSAVHHSASLRAALRPRNEDILSPRPCRASEKIGPVANALACRSPPPRRRRNFADSAEPDRQSHRTDAATV